MAIRPYVCVNYEVRQLKDGYIAKGSMKRLFYSLLKYFGSCLPYAIHGDFCDEYGVKFPFTFYNNSHTELYDCELIVYSNGDRVGLFGQKFSTEIAIDREGDLFDFTGAMYCTLDKTWVYNYKN